MTARRGTSPERLFIALDPPAFVRDEVSAWARHLCRHTESMRPVPAINTHVTLAFLGDQERGVIPALAELLVEVATPVPGLSLGAPIWLPKRRPRTLALELHDDRGELATAQSAVAGSLEKLIGWRAGRPFRAHLTAARTGRGFNPTGVRLPVSPALAFAAESVTLYSSTLSPDGARYEAVERVSFD